MHQNQNKQKHIPVLLDEVLAHLKPEVGDSYLDLTAGYGGHAHAVLQSTKEPDKAVLVDRDDTAIASLQEAFANSDITLLHDDFLSASRRMLQEGRQFDLVLADLGVSSPHLNIANRGFSIAQDGPLDMRMDRRQTLTAEHIVNTYSEADLSLILRKYGEEPKAKALTRRIIEARPIHTTQELAAIALKVWPRKSTIHPATRMFQALRIAVNREIELLEQALPVWLDLAKPGGRIAIISFHSLEDRTVKQAFAKVTGARYDATFQLLTKKPIIASPREIVSNPRARSAKLRAAVKIKNQNRELKGKGSRP